MKILGWRGQADVVSNEIQQLDDLDAAVVLKNDFCVLVHGFLQSRDYEPLCSTMDGCIKIPTPGYG